jgi:hypothetical protein
MTAPRPLHDLVTILIERRQDRRDAAMRVRSEMRGGGVSLEIYKKEYREADEHINGVLAAHLDLILAVLKAVDAIGLEVSPCVGCSRPILRIPDGLPLCDSCAAKERP